jgi:hypothetical protein
MPNNQVTLKVLNPRSRVEIPQVPCAPRIKDLTGKKIVIVGGMGDLLMTSVEEVMKKRIRDIQFHRWVWTRPPGSGEIADFREPNLEEFKKIAENSDGVIVLMGLSGGSTPRAVLNAAKIEKFGKPAVVILGNCFQPIARFFARSEGLPDMALGVLPMDYIPTKEEVEGLKIGEKLANEIIEGLTQWSPHPPETKEVAEETLVFRGKDYTEAQWNMENFFLEHCWSDGLPLVPPTEEAVNRMLEGTELPRDHVVALVEPSLGKATIEKIAINAVMAGCLPQYMPVIIAAVEAITDPKFYLLGIQCTSGQPAPLLVISGQKLIQELNINESFCTVGPGWRANTTIGRAIKLITTNLGHTWPGENDMKPFGNPFRYVTLIAENEPAYLGAWEPLRVAEGFEHDQATISVMPAISWQVDLLRETAGGKTYAINKIVEQTSKQAKVKFDRWPGNSVYNNLMLISPTSFDAIRREGWSRADLQKALYEAIQVPYSEFSGGQPVPRGRLPESLMEKCKADPETMVPLLVKPENLKICVAGGPGPGVIAYMGTWGWGPSYFVTKAINVPQNWKDLLEKYKGGESPVVRPPFSPD